MATGWAETPAPPASSWKPEPPSSSGTPAPPSSAAAIISINDHTPNPNQNLYDVTFQSDNVITTTVTADPSVVTSWITTLTSSPSPPRVIGFDVEWRPNRARNHDNPVATIQLCTKQHPNTAAENGTHTCLIFQVIHCPAPLPEKLTEFLSDEEFTFVGAGIETDVERLLVDYELSVKKQVDLGELAKQVKVAGLVARPMTGLKELAKVVLGVEVDKPKSVTMSRWDQGWLSYSQIQYACIDAFLSYEIGANLFSLPPPPPPAASGSQ